MRIPNWYRVESGGVTCLQAWNLHACGAVMHGYSARGGGVSAEPYASLNLSFTVGDDPDSVIENRRRFAVAIGVDAGRLVVPDQVHGNCVRVVTEQDAGSGALDHSSAIAGTDALITNTPNLPLALHFADCVCVFLVDPVRRAIGLAHAGWRGTVSGIVTAAVEAMQREFETGPKDLLAAIAPAVGQHCYEVGEDAAREIYKAFPNDERVLKPCSTGKWRADLKMANLILLRNAGLVDANIALSNACTSCNSDDCFSYRRDGVTGRMGGWLCLR